MLLIATKITQIARFYSGINRHSTFLIKRDKLTENGIKRKKKALKTNGLEMARQTQIKTQ